MWNAARWIYVSHNLPPYLNTLLLREDFPNLEFAQGPFSTSYGYYGEPS